MTLFKIILMIAWDIVIINKSPRKSEAMEGWAQLENRRCETLGLRFFHLSRGQVEEREQGSSPGVPGILQAMCLRAVSGWYDTF